MCYFLMQPFLRPYFQQPEAVFSSAPIQTPIHKPYQTTCEHLHKHSTLGASIIITKVSDKMHV